MGCGRSKHRSKTSHDDHDHDVPNGRAHKTSGAKHSKGESRDGDEGSRGQAAKAGGSKKEKGGGKGNDPPSQRSSAASVGNSVNGTVPHPGTEGVGSLRGDKLGEGRPQQDKKKTAFKDKALSGNSQNPQVTSSQLEFFRMLDERIEQGRDYDPDEES